MESFVNRWRPSLLRGTEGVAAVGGLFLCAVMVFTVCAVSMAGSGQAILGDTEVVELGSGIAIACFLPYCQMRGGNVTITTFTARLPAGATWVLDTFASLIVAVVVSVISWRLIVGGFDSYGRARASMFLELPQWWGFASAAVPCVLWTVVAWFGLAERFVAGPTVVSGKPGAADGQLG